MPITTRTAAPSDLGAIVEIHNQAVAVNATGHLDAVTVEDRRQWFEGHSSDYPLLVADLAGAVVGWSSFSSYRPGRGAFRHTAELSYYVDAANRRRGVASALIARSIELCSTLEFKTLVAILLDDNHASSALLTKFGFEQWAHMPDIADFDGREVGHLYYGLRIS